ncbi:hypothetical protein GCM10007921_37940 [Tritonibacter mobilis]|nr:hypothetical protein GCM10007921_37940 [Tritonibacter mobilis]
MQLQSSTGKYLRTIEPKHSLCEANGKECQLPIMEVGKVISRLGHYKAPNSPSGTDYVFQKQMDSRQ